MGSNALPSFSPNGGGRGAEQKSASLRHYFSFFLSFSLSHLLCVHIHPSWLVDPCSLQYSEEIHQALATHIYIYHHHPTTFLFSYIYTTYTHTNLMTLSQEQHTSFLSPTSPKPTAKPAPSPPSSLPSSPRNVISQPPSTLTSHFVQALHDYLPTNAPADDAVSCLFFRKGDIIEVFNRDSSGWWDGSSGGVRGWFPSNYVGRIGDAVRDGDFEDQKELEVWQRKRQANNENLNNNNTTATTESTTTVSRTNVSEVIGGGVPKIESFPYMSCHHLPICYPQ